MNRKSLKLPKINYDFDIVYFTQEFDSVPMLRATLSYPVVQNNFKHLPLIVILTPESRTEYHFNIQSVSQIEDVWIATASHSSFFTDPNFLEIFEYAEWESIVTCNRGFNLYETYGEDIVVITPAIDTPILHPKYQDLDLPFIPIHPKPDRDRFKVGSTLRIDITVPLNPELDKDDELKTLFKAFSLVPVVLLREMLTVDSNPHPIIATISFNFTDDVLKNTLGYIEQKVCIPQIKAFIEKELEAHTRIRRNKKSKRYINLAD